MITNEVQYRATKAHLEQFQQAQANLEAKAGPGRRSTLAQLEIDAVRSQADDLRAELVRRYAFAESRDRRFSERRNPITPA